MMIRRSRQVRRNNRGQLMGIAASFLIIPIALAVFYIVSNFCLGYYYQRKFDDVAQIAAQEVSLRPCESTYWDHQGHLIQNPQTKTTVEDAFRIMKLRASASVETGAALSSTGHPLMGASGTHPVILQVFYTLLTTDSFVPHIGHITATGTAPSGSQVGYLEVPSTNTPSDPSTPYYLPNWQVWLPIVKAPPLADTVGGAIPHGSWQLTAGMTGTPNKTSLDQTFPAFGNAIRPPEGAVLPKPQDPR
jgi:hypothetical protein